MVQLEKLILPHAGRESRVNTRLFPFPYSGAPEYSEERDVAQSHKIISGAANRCITSIFSVIAVVSSVLCR